MIYKKNVLKEEISLVLREYLYINYNHDFDTYTNALVKPTSTKDKLDKDYLHERNSNMPAGSIVEIYAKGDNNILYVKNDNLANPVWSRSFDTVLNNGNSAVAFERKDLIPVKQTYERVFELDNMRSQILDGISEGIDCHNKCLESIRLLRLDLKTFGLDETLVDKMLTRHVPNYISYKSPST